MVLRYFKLREQPFGVTPDPKYIYASAPTKRCPRSYMVFSWFASLIALTGPPWNRETSTGDGRSASSPVRPSARGR